jgi:ABC-type transport system involved in multi-copper enzyme maturation permease subunit
MKTWALIVDVFRQSRASAMFWVLLAITGLTAVAMLFVYVDGNQVVLFGIRLPEVEPDLIPVLIKIALIGTDTIVLRFVSLILMVIATGDFWPGFLNRGWVLLKLGKPISRTRIFLGRTLGAATFVAFQAVVFALVTFVVVGLRAGVWVWGHLLLVPIVVAGFLIVYSVSTLIGIRSRSPVLAILMGIGFWFVCWLPAFCVVPVGKLELSQSQTTTTATAAAVTTARDDAAYNVHMKYESRVSRNSPFYQPLHTSYLVLPKLMDLDHLFGEVVFRLPPTFPLAEEPQQEIENQPKIDWWFSALTTLAWMLLLYGLAWWRFVRSDY